TLGFTSDVAFLPDAGLGMVGLTNAQVSNSFNSAVRSRLFDLVFDDVDAEADAQALAFALEQMAELTKAPETLQDSVDVDVVQAYTGTFTNEALGEAIIELVDGELYLDAGSYRSELLPVLDEDDPETVDFYMTLTPPLAGLQLRFVEAETGEISIVFGSGVTEYTFTPVE